MNLKSIRDVQRMYKEKRGGLARENETVQEWILTHTGSEPGAVEGGEEARGAATAPVGREWEVLLAQNAPLAFRVARGVLRNDADAEDVAQEALVRAYQQFERLRERQRFRAWLVRITFRIALDRLRSLKRRKERESQWVLENARTTSSAGAEFAQHLERAVEQLPEKQRLVVLLAAM